MTKDNSTSMSQQKRVLVVAPDDAVAAAVENTLSAMKNVDVEVSHNSLVELNGKAVEMAARHDVVIFSADPSDPRGILAVEALNRAASRPMLIALTETDIPLSQARALQKAGVDEVLPLQSAGVELTAQIALLGRAEIAPHLAAPAASGGRIVAVAQARGGIGATTVAINLADQLAARHGLLRKTDGYRVALVDLDFQFGSIATNLDLPEQDGLLNAALDGTIPDATFLEQVMVELPNGIFVLPAPSRFAPLDALQPRQVEAVLTELRANFDYVVLDLPRALVGWLEPAIAMLDELIIVSDTSVPVIRNCRRLIDFLTADHPGLPVRIVINREKQPMFPPQALREAEKVLEHSFGNWLPDDPRAARAAIDRGKALSDVASGSALTKAISRLAKQVAEALPNHASAVAAK